MASITLSMIVKNEEKHLRECLESCKGIVDEIIIVDTGSTDRTLFIAEEYGAKIFHFEWVNDFSAARNYALQNSTGDWILYLDADERLTKESHFFLKKIKNNTAKIGYYCIVKSLDSEEGRDNSMSYVRLFANSRNIYFTGSVHEQILPSLTNEGYTLKDSNVVIEHIGYNIDNEKKKEKAVRNIKLLTTEYQKAKSTYYAFQLALTYEVMENYDEAKNYFLISAGDENFSRIYRAHSFSSLSLIYLKKHNLSEAECCVVKSLAIRPNDGFTNLLASKIYLRIGNYQKAFEYSISAKKFNDELIKGKQKQEYSIFLNGEEIYFSILAACEKLGRSDCLEIYYRKWIEHVKCDDHKNKKLAEGISKITRSDSLDDVEIESVVNYANKKNLDLFLLIIKRSRLNSQAKYLLEKLSSKFPGSNAIKKLLADLYVKLGMHTEAFQIYDDLYRNGIEDPSVYFNLLSFYVAQNQVEKRVELIEEIEKKFSSIPEVSRSIELIKSRFLQTV